MEDSVRRFKALFSGYTKAYGTYNPQTLGMPGKQKPSYMKVDALPTSKCFQHHLEGNQPIGIYLLDDDEMVNFAAIDIDAYPIDHAKISQQLEKWGLPFVEARLQIFRNCPIEVINVISLIKVYRRPCPQHNVHHPALKH